MPPSADQFRHGLLRAFCLPAVRCSCFGFTARCIGCQLTSPEKATTFFIGCCLRSVRFETSLILATVFLRFSHLFGVFGHGAPRRGKRRLLRRCLLAWRCFVLCLL